MLLSKKHNFAFLCTPKCASTSIEAALESHCEIRLSKHPSLKHINARDFHNHFLPMYEQLVPGCQIETLCIIRNPIDWLFSWYRYRGREALANPKHPRHGNYTGDISFNQFIEAYLLQEDAPSFAQVHSQFNFIKDNEENIGIDRIYAFERKDLLIKHLQEKLQTKLALKQKNQSPKHAMKLDPELEKQLKEHLQEDFRIYQLAKAKGCYTHRET